MAGTAVVAAATTLQSLLMLMFLSYTQFFVGSVMTVASVSGVLRIPLASAAIVPLKNLSPTWKSEA